MKLILALLPTIVLTAYSQFVIKWRVALLASTELRDVGTAQRILAYLLDPYIISAYAVSLLSSMAWFLVSEKYPLSISFPVYVGIIFAVVTVGGNVWLRETISPQHLAGILFILVGVVAISRAA